MSPLLMVLLVLAVVLVIGAGIFFQKSDNAREDEAPMDGPDSPQAGSHKEDGDGGGGSGGAGGDGGGGGD